MGAPKGNKNGANGHRWKESILRALGRASPGGVNATLDRIASRLVESAIEGDRDARQEIACRLDGKPTEHVQVEHTDHTMTYAEHLASHTRTSKDPESTVQ